MAEAGLKISNTLNDRWGMAQTLRQLGLISLDLGETSHAEDLLRQSVSKAREVCDLTLMAAALINLGGVLSMSGKDSESKQYILEALQAAMDTKTTGMALRALAEVAAIEMKEGKADLALELSMYILHTPPPVQN